jgi:hypothetical protein
MKEKTLKLPHWDMKTNVLQKHAFFLFIIKVSLQFYTSTITTHILYWSTQRRSTRQR